MNDSRLKVVVSDSTVLLYSTISRADFYYYFEDKPTRPLPCYLNNNNRIQVDYFLDYYDNVYSYNYTITVKVFPIEDCLSQNNNYDIYKLNRINIKIKNELSIEVVDINLEAIPEILLFIENLETFEYYIKIHITITGSSITQVSATEVYSTFEPVDNTNIHPVINLDFKDGYRFRYKECSYYSNIKQVSLEKERKKTFYTQKYNKSYLMLEDRTAIISKRPYQNDFYIHYQSIRNSSMINNTSIVNSFLFYQNNRYLNYYIHRNGEIFYNINREYNYSSGFLGSHAMYVRMTSYLMIDLCNQNSNQGSIGMFLTPNIIKYNNSLIYLGYIHKNPNDRLINKRNNSFTFPLGRINQGYDVYGLDYNKSYAITLLNTSGDDNPVTFLVRDSISIYETNTIDNNNTVIPVLRYRTIFYGKFLYSDPTNYSFTDFVSIGLANIVGTGGGYMITRSVRYFEPANSRYIQDHVYTYRSLMNISNLLYSQRLRKNLYKMNHYYYQLDLWEKLKYSV